jgi:parallel beta-helix repeat protein
LKAQNGLPVHNLNSHLNYTSIQEAISSNYTLSGHIIKVDAGTYYEHITISKAITLIGEGRDVTVIDGNGTGTVVRIIVSYVNISGITIRNAGRSWTESPWYIESCVQGSYLAYITIENVTCIGGAASVWFDNSLCINIRDSVVSDGKYLGIGGYDLENATIFRNVVLDYGSDGIHLDGGSRYCKVVNNTVRGGFDGISLETNAYSRRPTSDNSIDGNAISNITVANIGLFNCGTNVFRRNNMTGKQNNLVVWGYSPDAFVQDMDASNTANNKILYYLVNQSDSLIDPVNYPNACEIVAISCTNTTIRDFDVTSCMDGILLAGSANCTLMNVTVGNNIEPIVYQGVPLIYGGITLFESSNNTIVDCTVFNNTYGVCLYHSDGNVFYHNGFIDIDRYVVSDYTSIFRNASSGYVSKSAWDNGFEGNYWSDYRNADLNQDGIGDTPYSVVSAAAIQYDHYPLMGMFSSFDTFMGYNVDIISNSTIDDFSYSKSDSTIRMHVSSMTTNQTYGFCRICIPHNLMPQPYSITVDGVQPYYVNYTLYDNGTHRWIYVSYMHSTHEIIIVPEFLSTILILIFMIVTLVAVASTKEKSKRLRDLTEKKEIMREKSPIA